MACAARGLSPYDYLETDMRIRTQEPAKGAACGGSPAWQGPAHLAGICRSAATPSSLYSTAPGRAPKTSSSGSKSAAVNVADHACRHPWRFAATNPEPLRRTPHRYSSCSQGHADLPRISCGQLKPSVRLVLRGTALLRRLVAKATCGGGAAAIAPGAGPLVASSASSSASVRFGIVSCLSYRCIRPDRARRAPRQCPWRRLATDGRQCSGGDRSKRTIRAPHCM